MNIPLSAINISEEVNKTGIWKQVNETNSKTVKKSVEKKKSPKTPSRFKKKKASKKEEELKQKLEKKLSIMREEEEDEGLTIKCEKVAETKFWRDPSARIRKGCSKETHV